MSELNPSRTTSRESMTIFCCRFNARRWINICYAQFVGNGILAILVGYLMYTLLTMEISHVTANEKLNAFREIFLGDVIRTIFFIFTVFMTACGNSLFLEIGVTQNRADCIFLWFLFLTAYWMLSIPVVFMLMSEYSTETSLVFLIICLLVPILIVSTVSRRNVGNIEVSRRKQRRSERVSAVIVPMQELNEHNDDNEKEEPPPAYNSLDFSCQNTVTV